MPKLHAGAELILNRLLKHKDLNVTAIVRSNISPFRKSYWKYAAYGVRKMGVFYGIVFFLTVYLHVFGLFLAGILYWNRKRKWLSTEKLAKTNHIPLFEVDKINSTESKKMMKDLAPDVMITLSFDQILKKDVLEIPKLAALNLHPGVLPKYKGIFPEFWKIYNKEKYSGVTVHYLAEKVDAGDILAQVRFPIKKTDTKWSLAIRSAKAGEKILTDVLLKIKNGVKIKPIKNLGLSKYYSMPSKEQLDDFYNRGKSLFSIRDFIRNIKHLY